MTTTKIKISRLRAASADIGYCDPPGGAQAEKTCEIFALPDGRWEAIGEAKIGANQGYFQVNYEYGPWVGRGDTPQKATKAMIRRADDEYREDMERASSDALLDTEGKTFASLASDEAARIQSVIDSGNNREVVRIGEMRFHGLDDAARTELRSRAVAQLRRISLASGPGKQLLAISDDDLTAEVRRRGLL